MLLRHIMPFVTRYYRGTRYDMRAAIRRRAAVFSRTVMLPMNVCRADAVRTALAIER